MKTLQIMGFGFVQVATLPTLPFPRLFVVLIHSHRHDKSKFEYQ